MKYVVILGDGMADEPIESLGNKTILQAADTPFLDMLSKKSEIGMVHTVPDGMAPGSDTANLSVLGYDPKIYYSGRSPLEALSIGVPMTDTDIALRCNIVTISEEEGVPYEEQTIIDHSSSEISTEDCGILLEAVRKELENDIFKFYLGTSYRHCTIWHNGSVVKLTPPHDVLGQKVGPNLPETESLREMMKKSYEILKNHPLNIERKKKGLNPANSCWFWGAGTKPALSSFEEKTGKKGVMISAVDLLKGIAVGAGIIFRQQELGNEINDICVHRNSDSFFSYNHYNAIAEIQSNEGQKTDTARNNCFSMLGLRHRINIFWYRTLYGIGSIYCYCRSNNCNYASRYRKDDRGHVTRGSGGDSYRVTGKRL